MTIDLKDYLNPNSNRNITYNRLNYIKILKLNDRDFAELYLKLMEEYRDKDGWWGEKGIPHCSECNEEISGPKDLRRYCGASLHPKCFAKVIKQEEFYNAKDVKKYFNRVLKIDYSLLEK